MLRSGFLIICFSFFSLLVTAQERKEDSSMSIEEMITIEDSIDILLQNTSEIIKIKPTEAFKQAFRIKKLSTELQWGDKKALANLYMGKAKIELEDYYQARKYLLDALEYFRYSKSEQLKGDTYYLIGVTNYYLGNYKEAILSYRNATEIYSRLKNEQDVANTLQNVGLIHHNLDELDMATLYYKKALNINIKLENDTNIAGLYQNLGIVYFRNKQYDKSLDYYEKSIKLYKTLNDQKGIASTWSNFGLIYLQQGEYDAAFDYFLKSKQTFEKSKYKLGQMWALHNMGSVRFKQDRLDEAVKYFNASLEIAGSLHNPEGLISNYKSLSDLYLETSNYKRAYLCLSFYTQIRDSMHVAKAQDRFTDLESLYDTQQQERQLLDSLAMIKRQKMQKMAAIIILIILLCASVFIYRAYRKKKTAEVQLSLHKQNLERILSEKMIELKNQISERKIAEESDKLKSAFLANMSHELRTPMNAIIAFSNFLRDSEISKEKHNEYLEHITSAGESLLRLVDDIIDIAKIEARELKISISPTNISRLLRNLFSVFSELRTKNNYKVNFSLKIDVKNDYIISTDSFRIKQIISNLLENAFKYTIKGAIEFGASVSGGLVQFYVKDTGLGIPKEKQTLIFERFSQLEYALDRKFGGTGLGLAISKNLAELLDGRLWVDSEPGKGSTFYVEIPAKELQQVASVHEVYESQTSYKTKKYNWKTKSILVAEDEELNYKLLNACLSKTNVRIYRASDGLEAVNLCKNEKIDLVLMDIQMPVMDGYKATRLIKKMNINIPVIAQTSFAMANEKEKCLRAGCDEYLTKPLDIDLLFAKINSYLYQK